MVKGDRMDYFGFSGYTNEQLRKMGYAVWMPVQEKGSWIGEGDDFTYMNMLGNGLRAYKEGTYGGWGGRELPNKQPNALSLATDTSQQAMVAALSSLNKKANTYPDFFPAAQQDFAARLKWSVTPKYSGANHAPVVKIEGPLNVLASPGETIKLNGAVSDPDGDKVSIKWWQFPVGTYPGKISISNADTTQIKVPVPKDAVSGQTIHVILEVTDSGSPSFTGYQRVIITVK
jgi:hypothetical protein